MSYRLAIRIDREIDHAIKAFAKANRLTKSQAAREMLRQAMGTAEPVSRGWREGFSEGYADGQKAMQAGLAGVAVR